MITFEHAKQIATQKVGPDCGLVEEETLVTRSGWYFMYQSIAWLRTRDDRHMMLGNGGFIVDRTSGDIFEFGSLYPTERNIAAYEYGLRYEGQDLLVKKVRQLKRAVDHLFKVVNYVAPDPQTAGRAAAGGLEYHPPLRFERDEIEEKLRELPCIFRDCSLFYRYEEILAMQRSRCCDFEIRGS